jgi:PAS domain S-box-containing protein
VSSVNVVRKTRASLAGVLRGESTPVPLWAGYLLTVVLFVGALAMRLAMFPVDAGLPFLTFYPVVIVCALLFGTGPGLLAIALGAICADYLFLRPFATFAAEGREVVSLSAFVLTGGLTCFLTRYLGRATRHLRESEQKLRGLYEAPHVGIALTDPQGRYVEFNEAFRDICGYSAEELRDLNYSALTPKAYKRSDEEQLERLRSTGQYGPYEKEYVRKDGSLIPLQLNGALLKGSDGQEYIWSIVEDISARKKLETELAAESARNRLFLRTASDGVHIVNAAGRIVEASDSFCAMLGYSREEVIGMHPSQWDARLSPDDINAPLVKLVKGGRARFATVHRRKDGTTFDVEVHADGFELDGEPHMYCSARDVTEQRRLERAVLEAADREQRRLGHDLHDGLGQELTGIAMFASALASLERRAGRSGAEGAAQLEELTRRAISTCRAVARGLSPLGYTSGGLIEALEEMVSLQRETLGADTRFKTIGAAPVRLGPDASDHLYRIAQEAVTNARRHGMAQGIEVTLDIQPTSVRLAVLDDGIGFVPPSAHSPGMGLRIMQYRAAMIGARLSIGPGAHGGTLVACECPQPTEAAEELA